MKRDLSHLVEEAYQRIKPYIRETPLEYSFVFSKMLGCNVYLKAENYHTMALEIIKNSEVFIKFSPEGSSISPGQCPD